jgi:hypothetical protein
VERQRYHAEEIGRFILSVREQPTGAQAEKHDHG